ncbi:hypothetical protein Hanom_Chr12g01131981 [Helianthus anomalus]
MSMLSENVVAIGGCGEDCVDLNKSNKVHHVTLDLVIVLLVILFLNSELNLNRGSSGVVLYFIEFGASKLESEKTN